VALELLVKGVFLKDLQSQSVIYLRLSEEQNFLEYAKIEDPSTFVKGPQAILQNSQKVNLVDISDITPIPNKDLAFNLQLKYQSMILIAENRDEFVNIFDGLRCLVGMDMQSAEMKSDLNSLTEVKALNQMYTIPQVPQKPVNFYFAAP